MDNDNMLIKYHSYTTDQDFYISSGYYGQEYNMENDHRKIKQVRIYSCLGINPDDPKTDNLFPDTQFVFSINGDLIKKFSFIHNGNGIIYSRFSANINIEYIDPRISNNFRDGIDEPWTKTFCKCFAVVFFENNIEESNIKNNKIAENYNKEEIQEKTKRIDYTVTQYFPNTNEEPIVTIFDNEDNAKSCFEYYKGLGRMVCMDKCIVYKTFKILLDE